jgi:hypothetical protein
VFFFSVQFKFIFIAAILCFYYKKINKCIYFLVIYFIEIQLVVEQLPQSVVYSIITGEPFSKQSDREYRNCSQSTPIRTKLFESVKFSHFFLQIKNMLKNGDNTSKKIASNSDFKR